MIASNVQHSPRWLSLTSDNRGASKGMAFSFLAVASSSSSATNVNCAAGSTKRRISQRQVTRSTLMLRRVIHFMAHLLQTNRSKPAPGRIPESYSTPLVLARHPSLSQLIERCLEGCRQFFHRPLTPIVKKNHRGLGADHVMVNRHYLYTVASERLQNRCNFLLQHCDVARHRGVLVRTHKGGPRVQAHSCADRCAHFPQVQVVTAHGDFVDQPILFALMTHNPGDPSSVDLSWLYRGRGR